MTGVVHTSATSSRRTSGTVSGSRPSPPLRPPCPPYPLGAAGLGAGDDQERVRQQRQGDVAIPARPAADLVVVQADLTLGLLEALLHRPPGPGHPHQPDQRGGGRAVAGIEGQLPVAAAAAHQQPPRHPGGGRGGQLHPGPVVQPAALGAVPGAAGDPLAGRHRRGQLLSAGARSGRSINSLDLKQLGALDRQHVPHAAALQPLPERRAAAVDLIGGHPRRRHPGVQRALQHELGKLRLGPEPDLLGHPRSPAALRIVGPALGQVQLPVDHRPALSAGVGQEDAELAVVDLAGGARVLALDPDRGGALLEEPRLVGHQHRVRVAQVLDHVGAQVVADQLRVPVGGGQQPLHAVGGALAGVLGQLPAVLAAHVAQQAAQVGQRPPAWLGADKPSRDAGVQGVQPGRPCLDFLDVCRLVGLQHRFLLPSMALPAHPRPAGRNPTPSPKQVRLEY